MSVTQTVDIPDSRRLIIDVPREVPAGRTILTFTPANKDLSGSPQCGQSMTIAYRIFHPFQSYHFASWKKLLTHLKTEREKSGPLFGGIDGLEYQKEIRGEWENRL